MPSGSRGYNKYNNGGINAQHGVIVENNWQDQEGPFLYTILDFKIHQSFYLLRSAYKSSSKENEETGFGIFENVNYEADGRNLVREKINRTQFYKKKYICVDKGNGVFAVKSICVFSPDYPTKCFSNIAGEVECSEELHSKVLCSNVAFNCWLKFSFVPSSEVDAMKPGVNFITYTMHSIEHVNTTCTSTFDFILNAPWNKTLPRKMYEPFDPFATETSQKLEKISRLKAYFLSGKVVYIPGKSRMPVLLASNEFINSDKIYLRTYMPLYIHVFFSEVLQRWIVFDMQKREGIDLQATLTEDNYHETNLSPIFKCPGFFIFGKNGLVHDKYGELYEIYSRQFSTFNVFSYADPDERAYTPLEIPRSNKIHLSDLRAIGYEGIYIGNKEFYSPHLHYCLIKILDDTGCEIGYWYKLTVESLDDENLIVTVSAVPIPDYDHIPSKKVGNIFEFLVEISIERCAIFQFVVAPFLGAIGIKESECEKCFSGTVGACGIQFPPSQTLPEHRPQIRPIMIQDYSDVKNGIKKGNYK